MAFPHSVFPNDKNLIGEIKRVCESERVGKVILGQSLDYKRAPNPIMEEIERFSQELKLQTNLPIEYQDETLTTAQAERSGGNDASAAALILQSYVDRIRE